MKMVGNKKTLSSKIDLELIKNSPKKGEAGMAVIRFLTIALKGIRGEKESPSKSRGKNIGPCRPWSEVRSSVLAPGAEESLKRFEARGKGK